MTFFERLLSRIQRTTLLCSIWSILTIWNMLIFWSFLQRFLSTICCLSFFHWLGKFDSLNDIWCSNRKSWLTIPRLDVHEFMGHSITLQSCNVAVLQPCNLAAL
jgi:hypothetical protein